MYALRHPAVKNLWFDCETQSWTLDIDNRTEFTSQDDASDAGEMFVNSFDGFVIQRVQ